MTDKSVLIKDSTYFFSEIINIRRVNTIDY